MLTNSELESLEEKYFVILSDLLGRSIGKIVSQIYSQDAIVGATVPGRMNVIESAVENIVEGVVTEQLHWNVCSLPVSSDSCFECGDAIIHIDAKTVGIDDGDSRNNKVNLEAAQTTYNCGTPIVVSGKNWEPKLNHYEQHKMFGDIPNLTYVCKVIYSDNNLVEQIRFISIPHGQLAGTFGNGAILGAGRSVQSTGERGNIRFLVDQICSVQPWREKVIYCRK